MSSSLTRRTTYNQFVKSNRWWKIDFQFTDLSFSNQKPRCYLVAMASAPVTNERPLFWPTIQVRFRQKKGSPLRNGFYSETECNPLDSFIGLNNTNLNYWVIDETSEKIVWVFNWNLPSSSSIWFYYSAKLND